MKQARKTPFYPRENHSGNPSGRQRHGSARLAALPLCFLFLLCPRMLAAQQKASPGDPIIPTFSQAPSPWKHTVSLSGKTPDGDPGATSFTAAVQTGVMAGTGNNLPFWFTHNQSGRYSGGNSWLQWTAASLEGAMATGHKLKVGYGADLILLAGEKGTDARIIEAWAGAAGKTLSFRLGAFSDPEQLGGLSSSNGNLLRSLNARPYPRARLSTNGFVPLGPRLQVNAEYDEGLLTGPRVVRHPHLHHKSLTLEIPAGPSFRIRAGIDHYVFWGGTLPSGEKLAGGLKNYFRYILGKSGDSSFSSGDRDNVTGNQLGAYNLSIHHNLPHLQIDLLISHPFEDRSGMELANAQDNLYTLHFRKKKEGALLGGWLIEYLYTKNQSGAIHDTDTPGVHKRGRDNYFAHNVYQTGFSFLGYSLGTPLFTPLKRNGEGIAAGFENNRLSALHLGAKGALSPQLEWKALLSRSRNFGNYHEPYQAARNQVLSFGQLTWSPRKYPLSLSALIAIDSGKQSGNHTGLALQARWWFR